MGYNVFLERIWPIPSKTETLGTEIVVPIPTDNDKRITIPSLLVRCGATAQTLTVLQVKTLDYVALDAAGGQDEVTIQETTGDLTGRFAAIKLPDGSLFFSKITASTAKVQTLTDNLPAGGVKKDARFMIFATAAEDGNNSMLLEASKDTSLQAPCPGLFAGKDIGFPVILHLTYPPGKDLGGYGGVYREVRGRMREDRRGAKARRTEERVEGKVGCPRRRGFFIWDPGIFGMYRKKL